MSLPENHIPKITICGAAHLDRIGQAHAAVMNGHSNPGTFTEMAGGAAFNVASVTNVLEHPTKLYSILGKDVAADTIRRVAKARDLDIHTDASDKPTATYTSIVQPTGELFVAMADMEIYENYEPDIEALAKLSAEDWLCIDANLTEKAIETLTRHAPCKVAALATSTAKAPRLKSHLAKIDLLFANEDEFVALEERTCRQTVVTAGPSDVTIYDHNETTTLPVPPSLCAGDVVGAGDALAGATLVGLLSGYELAESVRLGIRASECILNVKGPWRADLATALGLKNESTMV